MKKTTITRLYVCLLFIFAAILSGNAQNVTVDIDKKPLKEFFTQIENQTGLRFSYRDSILQNQSRLTLHVKETPVRPLLDKVLTERRLNYRFISDNTVVVTMAAVNMEHTDNLIRVSGVVVDKNGEPLVGVSVSVEGKTGGTITDIDGKYSILVPTLSTEISFSYVGFTPVSYKADSPSLTRVVLTESNIYMDDVVVVGYSTRTREKLISSVSTIGNKELTQSAVPNLENALSGRVSGVFSRQTSGEPGADDANLQIRGFGSALVVVDGIAGRNFGDIDPSEIESISVLKDASAAAVYGMQGANGVILVTTKKGEKNKPMTFDVGVRYGLQMPHNYPEPASTDLWQTLVNEYYANMKLINDCNAVITPADMALREYDYDTNWYREAIKNAPMTQANININGGSDKITYFASFGYLYQGGIWSTNSTDKNRFNFRSNISVDLHRNTKLFVGVGGVINTLNYPRTSSQTIAQNIKYTGPNIPVRWPDRPEHYAFGGEGTVNPIALADRNEAGYSKRTVKDFNVDLSLQYNFPFLEGLQLKGVFGLTTGDTWAKDWSKNIVYTGYRADADEYFSSASAQNTNKASLSLTDGLSIDITGQAFLNFIRSFGFHNLNCGIVFEFSNTDVRNTVTSRTIFPSGILDQMAGGLSNEGVTNSEYFRKYRTASLIGRFSYDWRSRYFVDFNFRYDGAQYFARKWGFFPSASIGWLITNEQFMASVKPVLNELKIRGSWGKLGDLSSAKAYYTSNEQYYWQSGFTYPGSVLTFGDRTIYSLEPTRITNPDFTWSTSTMLNGGIDFRLWGGLLGGSADVFQRRREDLPAMRANDNAGALATYYNLNSDRTTGFEFSLSHNNKLGDFTYSVSGNLSWARTRNENLEHGTFSNGYSEWKWNNSNQWNNIRWGYNWIGYYTSYADIDNAPMHNNSNNNSAILIGDLKYEDWNGDGYIDEYDQRPIARTSYPEIMYGFNISCNWKGIDFSMQWQGGANSNFMIGEMDRDAFREGATYENTWSYFGDRWHMADYTDPSKEWISGHFPAVRDFTAVTINRLPSNFWMWSGNYLRLKNVELGYTLPTGWLSRMHIQSCRLYVNLYNFLTFSAQKYFDPESAENTYSFAGYPQIKTFNAGINIKF